jgi:hypothetical protein
MSQNCKFLETSTSKYCLLSIYRLSKFPFYHDLAQFLHKKLIVKTNWKLFSEVKKFGEGGIETEEHEFASVFIAKNRKNPG